MADGCRNSPVVAGGVLGEEGKTAMKRSLATALALASALAAGASLAAPALAQSPPALSPATSPLANAPLPSQMGLPAAPAAPAPPGSQCNDFMTLRTTAQERAMAVKNASIRKVDRKVMCQAVQRFYAAEEVVVKFLEQNQTWCAIPEAAVAGAKTEHEKTAKFRDMVCSEAPVPKPHVPSLSEAIGTPTLDTAKNTKTGRGTFDTLTGNPLAK